MSYVDESVISGLPWAVITAAQQGRVLDRVTAVLSPEGRFTTFAYGYPAWTPPAREVRCGQSASLAS
ncbi:hypothetical protein [Amycolatopsis magusensis]|uniref:hypothetical protein n=1 Tax=Amycolatopsis magusensis TaxID=882444 RepID=UPI0024A90DFE|nr:hypothetical protein [Amycolatopsis magusensis]MDI5977062.1 hypothetical protein [Amycolatopsis magusensis]